MEPLISNFTLVVSLFILTYGLIIFFYNRKTIFIWIAIVIFFIAQVLNPLQALAAINWNVLGIYVGMLFISELFIYSKAPEVMAEKIVSKSPKLWIAMLGVCALAGFISIVVENVAVVLIIAPVAFYIADKLKIHPGPLIIGIAVSSNLQGVATMIGDPPSLLLADYAGLRFNDFFVFLGKPSLFFAVQIAAFASLFVLFFFYRKYSSNIKKLKPDRIVSWLPITVFVIMIAVLVLMSLHHYHGQNETIKFLKDNEVGLICLLSGLLMWGWYYSENKKDFIPMIKRFDWDTALFLMGVFIMVEALVQVGFMEWFAVVISGLTGNNILIAFILIIVSSVLLSGFVDNVPFIAAMLPVVDRMAEIMGISPYLFFFGLVIGASVGGNITPVGASANIVAMGMLKNRRFKVTFWDFMKIGLPFTIVSVLASTLFIWLMYR
ncbi:anion permease [Candidatus Woesearchaeota archaeon]|nr:anion permease [Candidatus Woesearchaeota archaeon]